MTDQKPYWFKRRVYGFGWGKAGTWQGWTVYAIFAVLALLAVAFFPPATQPEAFAFSLVGLAVLLVIICWLKGESPAWRWGND